jgi:hypothetical protein
MPTNIHMLKHVADCPQCGANRFLNMNHLGSVVATKVDLKAPDIPNELIRLWSSADADARHFCNNIRFFNGHFSHFSISSL